MNSKSQDSNMGAGWSVSARFWNLPSYHLSRFGRIDAGGLLALGWFLLLVGFVLTGGAAVWIHGRSALQLSVSEFLGFSLVWSGGLLLVLSLRGLDRRRRSSIRGLLLACIATFLATDVPWLVGAVLTASRPDLMAIHTTCLVASHVALAMDALLVLTLALGAMFLLACQQWSRVTVLRSVLAGVAGFAVCAIWAAHGWRIIQGHGVRAWEFGLTAGLVVAIYGVGRWRGQRRDPFSAGEMLHPREIRSRYRTRGLTP